MGSPSRWALCLSCVSGADTNSDLCKLRTVFGGMESIATVPQKQRKTLRKRQYVKYVKFLRKQLRRRNGVEVRPKQWEGGYLEHIGTSDTREAGTTDTMQADAFWKNYATAQEWQNRFVKRIRSLFYAIVSLVHGCC